MFDIKRKAESPEARARREEQERLDKNLPPQTHFSRKKLFHKRDGRNVMAVPDSEWGLGVYWKDYVGGNGKFHVRPGVHPDYQEEYAGYQFLYNPEDGEVHVFANDYKSGLEDESNEQDCTGESDDSRTGDADLCDSEHP